LVVAAILARVRRAIFVLFEHGPAAFTPQVFGRYFLMYLANSNFAIELR
jgi:hypothetical protein